MPVRSNEVTVILTAYKRNHFPRQIPAILAQSWKPSNIIVWQNGHYVDLSYIRTQFGIPIIHSDINYKFWGRFALSTLVETEYVAIFDDDIIPGPRWLENCRRLSQLKNCICGANGRNMANNNPDVYVQDSEYAFVGHCWFFKKEWLHHMFAIEPYTYDNGEDIHFCACCKLLGGISSWVPAQHGETSSTLDDLGVDHVATFLTANHEPLRMQIIDYFRKKGW